MTRGRDFSVAFNRTSLELKRLRFGSTMYCPIFLLIEPVWNWNMNPILCVVGNRTFNRTSLELKLIHLLYNRHCLNLLIEPVWNWNPKVVMGTVADPRLLIEPVWNWNRTSTTQNIRFGWKPFNRTSLELKRRRGCLGSAALGSFNRTSLELKHFYTHLTITFRRISFNRTSLELKRPLLLSESTDEGNF